AGPLLRGPLTHCASCARVAAGCVTQDTAPTSQENPEHLSGPTPADGVAGDAGLRLANALATLQEPTAPKWCAQPHVLRRETGEFPDRPCGDARRSVRYVRDGLQRRDLQDLLRTPLRCDAPRTPAPRRQCENVGSFPFALPSPLPVSLAVRLEIPRKRGAKDTGQQLAAVFERGDHEPALTSSLT